MKLGFRKTVDFQIVHATSYHEINPLNIKNELCRNLETLICKNKISMRRLQDSNLRPRKDCLNLVAGQRVNHSTKATCR